MRNSLYEHIRLKKLLHHRHSRAIALLLVLSLVVSVQVFWFLRQPGIALAGDADCGLVDHVHNDECYDPTPICGLEDGSAHVHDDGCYELQWVDAVTETVCICDLTGDETHTHTEECYTEQTVQEAGEQPVLTCTRSTEPHVHTDDCYSTVPVCGMQEHTHTPECYCDENADTETLLDWQSMFPATDLTGELPTDLVTVALSQLSYTESQLNFQTDELGVRHGYTRYGAWYGLPYHDWSALFVSFCLHYAGSCDEETPYNIGADAMARQWQQVGRYADADFQPCPGDLVFFTDQTVAIITETADDRLTIVQGDVEDAVCQRTVFRTASDIRGYGTLSQQQVNAISDGAFALSDCDCGNSALAILSHADSCARKAQLQSLAKEKTAQELAALWTQLPTDCQGYILTYLSWNSDYADKLAQLKALISTVSGELQAACNGVSFAVSGDLPAGAALTVTPKDYTPSALLNTYFDPNDHDYLHNYWVYDISIQVGGEDWQPTGEVQVTVTSENFTVTEQELFCVAHLTEDDPIENARYLTPENGSVTFTADSFSPYLFFTLDAEARGGEKARGGNWMQLRDSGWFTYWEQFLTEDTEVPSTSAPAAELPNPGHDDDASDKQVSNWGGATTSEDGLVTVSKTIDGTDTENVFDITLTVQTQQKIEEIYRKPDMSVVIVMDISNTMNDAFPPNNSTDQTRYKAAMLAAEDFLDKFVDGTSDSSEIGYVAFNTSAHQIFGLQNCTTELQANALKNTMRQSTGNIINANGYSGSPTRFTNIEAGLNMAQDMLENASSDYKYIIFLSDGFPTTYVNRNQGRYTGYSPYSTTGTPGTDGVFYDGVAKHYCTMGTNYSDKAAIRASEEATAIKESGITIFSIGVNVEGQTIQSSLDKIPHYYFVDRTSTTYALGGASDTQAFKDWLKNKIGSGYYYDSTDTAGLKAAYADIFEKISSLMGEASKGEWVTEDPLPTSSGSPSQPEELEFIGFYEKDGTLRYDPDDMSKNAFKLIGTAEEDGENSATFTPGTSVIHWDLKTSGYTSSTKDGATTYFYSLTYRVRLKNELRGFVENQPYNTNQPTSMTYRVIETKDGKVTLSKTKKVDYLIPAVHGYLGELTFRKTDPYGHDLAGAVFTLTHDTSSCNICRGDGKNTVERVGTYTATSDETGNVKFTGIPSGHIYTLKETKAPDGYLMDDSITYTVQIAYDQVTVTGKNSSGQDITWNREILNTPITHELPATGGSGLWPWLLTGSALCIGSLTAMTARRKRKKQ